VVRVGVEEREALGLRQAADDADGLVLELPALLLLQPGRVVPQGEPRLRLRGLPPRLAAPRRGVGGVGGVGGGNLGALRIRRRRRLQQMTWCVIK
jgi:hypothetical protein